MNFRRTSSTRRALGALSLCLLASACTESDETRVTSATAPALPGAAADEPTAAGEPTVAPGEPAPELAASTLTRLIVVTERESPEAALQYLHVLEGWPESMALDYASAIELGEFPSVHARFGAVYVYLPDSATVRKLVFDSRGGLASDESLSFAAYGVSGYDPELLWADPETSYLVDESSGQLIRWNPSTMLIDRAVPIPDTALARDGFPLQLQQGVISGGVAFSGANWRNWDTYEYRDLAALAFFDLGTAELQVVEDERCAPSVALSPFDGGDGYVYQISDAALGFDAIASPNLTSKPLCVLRIRPGDSGFDPSFRVDLRRALGAPGFYSAHPMRGGKLLVHSWAPGVDVASVADPGSPDWYWDYPPYFEYQIVELATGVATPVTDIPRGAVQFSATLRVDEQNYVQIYRDDGGSDLHRVDPDATVQTVLTNGPGTDVQYLGRVELSR